MRCAPRSPPASRAPPEPSAREEEASDHGRVRRGDDSARRTALTSKRRWSGLSRSTRLNVQRVRSLEVDENGSVYVVAEVGTPGSVVIKISPAPLPA